MTTIFEGPGTEPKSNLGNSIDRSVVGWPKTISTIGSRRRFLQAQRCRRGKRAEVKRREFRGSLVSYITRSFPRLPLSMWKIYVGEMRHTEEKAAAAAM